MGTISFNEMIELVTAPSQEDKERSEFAHQIMQNITSNQLRICTKCGKTHPSTQFFSFKDDSKDWQCRACRSEIDLNNEEEVRALCKDFNVPYIKDVWRQRYEREKERNNGLVRKQAVCGKYLATMKLRGYKDYTYEDSDMLNELREQKSEWEKIKQDNPNLSEHMDIIEKINQLGTINPIPCEELKTILPIQENFNLERELEKMEDKKDNINPKHYRRDGGFESIEEMEMIFGIDATMNFCLLNVWKYRYRAADKNGEEDLRKSDWYMRKYKELKEKKDKPIISGSYISTTPTDTKTVPLTMPSWTVNTPTIAPNTIATYKTEIQNC